MKYSLSLFILVISCANVDTSHIKDLFVQRINCDGANCCYLSDSLLNKLISTPNDFAFACNSDSIGFRKWLTGLEDCSFVDYSGKDSLSLVSKKDQAISSAKKISNNKIKANLLEALNLIKIRKID